MKLGIRAFSTMITNNQRLRWFDNKREGECSMAWKMPFVS